MASQKSRHQPSIDELLKRIEELEREAAGLKRREERRLETQTDLSSIIVNNTLDGVIVVQDRSYKLLNKAWIGITGYSERDLTNMSIFEIITPEYKELVAQRSQARLEGDTPPPTYEVQMRCKDGSIKDIELSASIIEFNGKPADLVILRDIMYCSGETGIRQ